MDYPFIKCLHPKKIVNPYTRETILVKCGHCEACQSAKSSQMALKCKLESLSHKYCMFVTLTYSDEFVPRMSVLPLGKNFEYSLVSISERQVPGTILGVVNTDGAALKQIYHKTNLNRYFPYLDKRDIQLFMKRLRKNLSKYTDEKIRYFAAGEYGPVHFRPHYHLLLWFDSDITFKNVRQAICSSWKYGRIDTSISKGKASSYVAGYLNGSCYLPKIYQCNETKPFTCHSFFLGEKFLRANKETVYAQKPSDFNKRSICIDGTNTDVISWRSLTSYYFPRCEGYDRKSKYFRMLSYTMYAKLSKLTEEVKPYKVAEATLMYVVQHGVYSHDAELTEILISLFPDKVLISDFYTNLDKLLRNIYMNVRLSYHFLTFCCDDHSDLEVLRKLDIIDNYYKSLNYDNLCNQLSIQETMFSECCPDDFLKYFYDNSDVVFDDLEDSLLYRQYQERTLKHYNDSFKHKKLNDANRIFMDI